DGGDENVALDGLGQQLGRRADDTRDVARSIDDGVERAALERGQVAVAVAVQVLHIGKERGIRATAVEERQLVPPLERRLRDRAADEQRAAQDEQLHAAPLPNRGFRSATPTDAPANPARPDVGADKRRLTRELPAGRAARAW